MTVTDIAAEIRARLQHGDAALPNGRARKAIREAAGISTKDLAEILGVTRQSICNWEAGRRSPKGEQLRRYREALDAMRSEALHQGAA